MRLARQILGPFILILLVLASACSETPTPTPLTVATVTPTRVNLIPTAAPGWSIYKRSTYQIALPDAWQEIKLQDTDLRNSITAAQDSNPPLADVLRTLLESGQYKGFIFYAAEKAAAPRTRTVSIARSALPPSGDISSVAQAYAKVLPSLVRGAQVTGVQAPLNINGLDAAAFGYTISLVDNQAKLVTLRGAQYLYALSSGDAYLVTITGDASDAGFEATARDIAESFAANNP